MNLFRPNESYASPAIESLINKAFNYQWSVDTKINWDREPVLPEGIPREDYIDMVSQLYYAEVLTIHLCAKLINEVPDFQAKRFICTQMADESRHAQAYAMYVAKLGELAPINGRLKAVFEKGMAWKGSYCGIIVALNVVLEGESLNQQRKRIETLPCPLFRDINASIVRDESRHAAFGITYMSDKLREMPLSERAAILQWISSLWDDWEKANEGRYEGSNSEILRTNSGELRERFVGQVKVLERIGLIS